MGGSEKATNNNNDNKNNNSKNNNGRERAIEALIDMDPKGASFRAAKLLVRCFSLLLLRSCTITVTISHYFFHLTDRMSAFNDMKMTL